MIVETYTGVDICIGFARNLPSKLQQ